MFETYYQVNIYIVYSIILSLQMKNVLTMTKWPLKYFHRKSDGLPFSKEVGDLKNALHTLIALQETNKAKQTKRTQTQLFTNTTLQSQFYSLIVVDTY